MAVINKRTRTVEKWLDGFFDEYMEEVVRLAASLRKKHVVPFCDKHRLNFITGNGTWCFFTEGGHQLLEELITEVRDGGWNDIDVPTGKLYTIPDTKKYGAKVLLEILKLPVPGVIGSVVAPGDLGSFMEGYDAVQADEPA